MKSDLPKVLHNVCGRPMLAYVFDACLQAGCDRLIGVIGHRSEMVKAAFAGLDGKARWVIQEPQLGTGHAVMVCKDELAGLSGPVLVLAGDGPLLRPATLKKLLQTHLETQAACTLATSVLEDPAAYGRVVRDAAGELSGIVEYLDASPAQRQIKEVNVSVYCFDAAALRDVAARLTNNNAKGEYYLTDALSLLKADGKKLAAVAAVPAEEVLSINTLEQLAEVEGIMQRRQGCSCCQGGRK
jgi:bifunctional UDP-N-acetylglucosamine pyrophosphorylase/glucosamine-1-phosphate N-acetyltransferase